MPQSKGIVTVVGAGLAGSEAAWQIARRGVRVRLIEMRPETTTKAHKTSGFAELVCSNSFRGADLSNAVGLLKEELKIYQSLMMKAAAVCRVPAGGALAVDREAFSHFITQALKDHPLIEVELREVKDIPLSSACSPVIVASGPLTSRSLSAKIEELTGTESLAFFDAISPIFLAESLNMAKLFRQSRYDKGSGADYLNCPLNEQQYYRFVEEVGEAEKYGGNQDVESDSLDKLRPFEGCMPIEEMIARGKDTLRFGPFKPKGLTDPATGRRPFAVLQLRQDDKAGELWSLVGMQTRMKRHEQERIFRSLPGLENAEFVRYGSVHRNTFIDSPKFLQPWLEYRGRPGLFFAGQITGVEGYVESASGGLVAGINAARAVLGETPVVFPSETAIGSLMNYISDPSRTDFQPMNVSYGLIQSYTAPLETKKKTPKRDRRREYAEKALMIAEDFYQRVAPPALPSETFTCL